MLATLGFGFTALLLLIFAGVVKSAGKGKLRATFTAYSEAYLIVAAAFVMWSICSAINDSGLLALSVVVGDTLLLVATLFIASILLSDKAQRRQLLWTIGLVGVALLAVRTIYFYPEPYMTRGVLFFNSQRAVSFTLSAVFLLIWLPVNLQVARLLTVKVPSQERLFKALYTMATFSTVIFLLSKTPLSLSLSFSAMSVSFLVLILSARYVNLVEERSHGK